MIRRKRFLVVGIILLVLPISGCKLGNVSLTILQTSDVHDHASGYGPFLDYTPLNTADHDQVKGGYARLATLINQIRCRQAAKCIPTLIFDSGDFFMGTVYDLTAANPIALKFFSAMKYDAVTLGNHEFDWAPTGLYMLLSNGVSNGFDVPVVATNMVVPENNALALLKQQGLIQSSKVIEYPFGLKVGIIGLMGKDSDSKAPVAKPVTFNHDYAFIQQQVDELRKKKHCQLVIALSHGGVENNGTGDDADLAKNVKGIDIIASGHYHTETDKALIMGDSNTIIFSPGEYGEHLSRLDITYNVLLRKVMDYKFTSIPVDDAVKGDAATQAMVETYHAAINTGLAPLHLTLASPVSKTTFPFELASLTESNLGDLAADALRAVATLTSGEAPFDFSVVASGVIRDYLYPGKTGYLSFADIYNVLPLGISPDTSQPLPGYPLMSMYVNALDLRNICEVALSFAPFIGSDYYLNFSGLKVKYVASAPLGQRVRAVSVYPVTDFPCIDDTALVPVIDLDTGIGSPDLFHCVVDLYALQMMGVVTSTLGLEIVPLDAGGVPINPANYMNYRIDTSPDAGVQELKEWMALLQYLGGSFPASGAGIPEWLYGQSGIALGRIN